MRLTGLDFETANRRGGSICAAGCALVEDGVVSESRGWRLCPARGYRWMLPEFTAIHGLAYWDVKDCPEFPLVWPELRQMLLAADCVVIHRASFDLGHLRRVLALYQLPPVAFAYVDSLHLTRQLLPDMASHSLDAVAARMGIVFHHHDAQEDAAACAVIMARLGIPAGGIRRFEFDGT